MFTPEILYNVLGMAIEKYCLALLYYKENMPDNHTFTDLVDAMSTVVSLPEDLREELKALQGYQEICSLSAYVRNAPDRTAILEMIETTRRLESFVKTTLRIGWRSQQPCPPFLVLSTPILIPQLFDSAVSCPPLNLYRHLPIHGGAT